MAFEPRMSEPSYDDPHWIRIAAGGWNPCIPGNGGPPESVLPNCVGYAWGRFYEILGEYPTLATSNATTWFANVADGYERGTQPEEGAVCCFAYNDGGPGHVCIVERVLENGDIVVSESGWSNKVRFRCLPISRQPDGNYIYSSKSIFQGFIYNPAVRKITHREGFMNAAQLQVGKGPDWTISKTGIKRSRAWGAAFVVACAKEVGVLNVIMPDTFSCSGIGRIGYLRKMGNWLPGPSQGRSATPELGDVILFRTSKYEKVNTYAADRCGIVVNISGSNVKVVQGDSGGKVVYATYPFNSKQISGYYRPNWDYVDKDGGTTSEYREVQGLYTGSVSHNDAALKQIGYLDSNLKPSIQPSKIKLSLLNYTGLLSNLYSVFGTALSTSTDSNTRDQADITSFYLGTNLSKPPGRDKDVISGTRGTVIATALKYVGVTEEPKGSNSVIFNDDYYGRHVSGSSYPWCAAFLWDIFRLSGLSNIFIGGGKSASTSFILNYYRNNRPDLVSKDLARCRPGDLVFYSFGRTSAICDHIGLIVELPGGSTFVTVEGNTSSDDRGDQSNGGGVFKKKRGMDKVVSFVHLPYGD